MKSKKIICSIASIFFSLAIQAQDLNKNLKTESDTVKNKNQLEINPRIGAALVRNTISPSLNLGLSLEMKKFQTRVSFSSYYFFERSPDKKFTLYDNYFVEGEFLFLNEIDLANHYVKHWTGGGIGYLIDGYGGYFPGTTLKVYFIEKFRYFQIRSELYFTNDFKIIFPSLSILF